MTTPTREQVVQWATDSNGQLVRGAHPGMIGFYPTALDNFTTLARADLEATIAELQGRLAAAIKLLDADTQFEADLNRGFLKATIAEQAAEIDRGAIQFLDLSAQICSLKKDVQRLQMALADTEALEAGTAERLVASQTYAAQLREALSLPCDRWNKTQYMIVSKALAIQPDETALREHDAKLVERIASFVASLGLSGQEGYHCADKIKKGEF